MIGRRVEVVMDCPMGTYHPRNPDLYYEVNYDYVPGVNVPLQ